MISKNYFYLYMFFCVTLISAGVPTVEVFASQTSKTIISTVTIVRPSLSLTPTSGAGGTVVIVTGSNFEPNASIRITFVDLHDTDSLGTIKADATGSFAKMVEIPDDAYPGTAMISAQQKDVTLAQTAFIIPFPKISPNPTSGQTGTEVTITGSGFALDEKIKLFIGHDITNHLIHIGEVTTDNIGSFKSKASIPSDLLAGNYFISAREDINNKIYAAASFTVTSESTTTTLRSSVNPSTLGQRVTFTATISPVEPGNGTPTGTVTFSIDGVSQPPLALSDNHVTMTTNILTKGSHQIVAKYSGDSSFNSSTDTITQTVR